MAAQNYTLPITKMAYVDKSHPSANYSGGDTVHVGRNSYIDANNNFIDRPIQALLYAAGFPELEGLILSNLKLHFTVVPGTNTENQAFSLTYLSQQWVETGVNYNTRPSRWFSSATGGASTGVYDLSQAVGSAAYEDIKNYGMGFEPGSGPYIADVSVYSHLAVNPANRPYFTFTVTESIPSGMPVSPIKKFVDVTADTAFIWEYINAAGGKQKSYELQVSPDKTVWETISAGTTSATSIIIPANTLGAAVRFWRVKVVSENDAISPWSEAVEIKLIAAPSVMINVATQSPRPLVKWTCDGQLGYRVICGDHDSGVIFGTGKEYQCPIYLPDGDNIIAVQTQGAYGLWSQWSSQTITVLNVPGDAIALTVYPTHRAKLAWSGGGSGDFYILRDGVPIAKIGANTYTDEFVIGKHTYRVLEQLPDGNYTLSNAATATMRPEHAVISSVPHAAWMDINLSREAHRAFSESHAATVAMIHYAGRALPVAEKSEFVDKTLSFDVAFRTQKDAAEFEMLLGEIVCYKTKIGRMMIGMLAGFSVDTDRWFSQYSCTITATDYREEITYE